MLLASQRLENTTPYMAYTHQVLITWLVRQNDVKRRFDALIMLLVPCVLGDII